jgi:tRNA pseudouridine13 synthase
VEELPLYPVSGKGTHLYFRVTKTGIPTPVAANRLARYMGVHPGDVGVAGLKDSQALTTQMMSIEYAQADRLQKFRDRQMSVEVVGFHGNKLRPGLLAGNRFTIRIRGVGAAEAPAAKAVLDVLVRRGVPNFFGEQRFGARGDTGLLGELMVKNDLEEFVRVFLGRSMPCDPPDCRAARDAFDAGFIPRALQRWPRHYTDQRRALMAFKRRQSPTAALAAIDKRMKRLFVSAFQSEIFNQVLIRRLGTLDAVLPGDLAMKTDNEAVFLVEDAAREQQRAERFEISPTGAVPGYRSSLAQGDAGEIERQAIAERGITLEDFRRVGTLKVKGTRRPLRFAMVEPRLEPGRDSRGEFLELAFSAAPGCYATVVLREIMKTPQIEAG